MTQVRPILLILAAGMGSRYGGLKQMDSFGPNGETIIDYSIYDAIKVGFQKIVFVIRQSFAQEFINQIEEKWQGKIELEYVFQELDSLPDGMESPNARLKPWGTGHAVWVAKDNILGPFGVINADDFYGRDALEVLFNFLIGSTPNYALVSYPLVNTLSDHGAVNRGVCEITEDHNLKSIVECKNIHKLPEIYFEQNGLRCNLDPDAPVSMNMWGFQSNYFQWAQDYFIDFLKKYANVESAEFYIPDLIQHLIDTNQIQVNVLQSLSNWIGVTYKEDKPLVASTFNSMIASGEYPTDLV